MPYRTYTVSTRTLLQLTAVFIFLFFMGGVEAALAACSTGQVLSADGVCYNAAAAPVVIPSKVVPLAGNTHSTSSGYAGDGAFAQGPTFSYPTAPVSQLATAEAVAVDSVGNVYLADSGNDIIREISAQTGNINTIAGIVPSKCSGATCSTKTPGCANGVAASGAGIGSGIYGLAVDEYGNIYYADSKTYTVSVIYKGGTRVASFIKLVNSAGVANSGGVVKPGYVYYIGGAINLNTCTGSAGTNDNMLAFADMNVAATANAQVKNVGQLSLDSAGNIYIADNSSYVVHVINTQTTAQNFMGFTVQPGYMKALFPCNTALTVTTTGNSLTSASSCVVQASTFGSPASTSTYYNLAAFGGDAWGNLYVANGSTKTPANVMVVAYAGGPLGHLLNTELTTGGGQTNNMTATSSVTPVYGDLYEALNEANNIGTAPAVPIFLAANQPLTISIRPTSIGADALGNLWFADNHYPMIVRIDVNSQTVTGIIGSSKERNSSSATNNYGMGLGSTAPTVSAPIYCDYGQTGGYAFTLGPQTYDIYGDNCPAVLAGLGGYEYVAADGPGNIIFSDYNSASGLTDSASQLIRELLLDTVFPATAMTGYPVGYPGATATGYSNLPVPVVTGPVTQAIQIHFDQWNVPSQLTPYSSNGAVGANDFITTSSISIAPSLMVPVSTSATQTPDFTIDTTDAEFPLWFLYGDNTSMANHYSKSTAASIFYQAGAPTCNLPSSLTSRTPGGAVTGVDNTDPDWGYDCLVYVTFNPQAPGLREAQLVVTTQQMTPNGNVKVAPTGSGVYNTYYIPLIGTGYGAQLAIDGGQQSVVPVTGFTAGSSGPNAVAVNSAGVVYATDPAGNRIIVSPPTLPTPYYEASTTNGSAVVTLASLSSTAGLATGLSISGTNIPANTTIVSIGTVAAGTQGTITLSNAATATSTGNVLLYVTSGGSYSGATTNNSKTVAMSSSTLGLAAGQTITGTNIPANTTIASVGTTGSITLSNAATATGTGISFTVAIGPTVSGLTKNLSGPMGVAVDAANNVYISDTGNNQILKVNPVTTAATQLGNTVWVSGNSTSNGSTTDPAQYAFKAPQGLAVDTYGNVYVADTGNGVVVEIPSNPQLGGAFAMLQNTGVKTTFTTPVAVAVDQRGNVYVADTAMEQVVVIPAGGGDFLGGQYAGNFSKSKPFSGTFINSSTTLTTLGSNGISTPNGVAVDAAGNVYISDSSDGAVWVTPTDTSSNSYILNLAGTISPAGLALDQNGNVYVADSGLGEILYLNRKNPTASFGIVPEGLAGPSGLAGVGLSAQGSTSITTSCPVTGSGSTCSNDVLTVTNIGNATMTLPSPAYTLTRSSTDFAIASSSCGSTLAPGATCVIAPTFMPTSTGAQSAILTIGSQSVSLSGATEVATSVAPLVKIVLDYTSSGTKPPSGGDKVVISATVTQPHTAYVPNGYVPTGWIDFTWGINGATVNSTSGLCGINGGNGTTASGAIYGDTGKIALNSSGVATFALPNTAGLNPGLRYAINATFYPGDGYSSQTNAVELDIQVIPSPVETVTIPSASFAYGAVPPTLGAGSSVTPALATGNSVSFTTDPVITQCDAKYGVGVYNIKAVFSGPKACDYGSPTVYNPNSTTQATVTETSAPLSVSFVPSTMSVIYGTSTVDLTQKPPLTFTGTECGDGDGNRLSALFALAGSAAGTLDSNAIAALNVSATAYSVVPTPTGNPITANDYSPITASNLSLTIQQAPPSIAVNTATTSVLQASLSSATFKAVVTTAVSPQGHGTPTGTVFVTDTFTPYISTAPGYTATIPACSVYFTGSTTSGSTTVSNVSSTFGLVVGETLTAITSGIGTSPLATGTTLAAVGSDGITLSANATATASGVVLQTTLPSTTTCITTSTMTLLSGQQTYTTPAYITVNNPSGLPTGITPVNGNQIVSYPGSHQYGFAYGGDTNFTPGATGASGDTTATGGKCATKTCLIVDNADFALTSSSGVIQVYPGVVPGYGVLAAAVGQVSGETELAYISIVPILSQSGVVSLTCTTQHPSYVYCQMTPAVVTLTGSGNKTTIISVWTPETLPLGFNTSQVRISPTRTAWAFLPLGVLAFCIRRRRNLSKALWMLIAIAAVSVGMSGCGGNQVSLYTPVPQGAQTVTVTGSGYSSTNQNSIARSYIVDINID